MIFFRFPATLVLACLSIVGVMAAQDPPAPADPVGVIPQTPPQAPPDKRIFGVLPNYRTANESAEYAPITTKQKFIIASKDSFDYPLVLVAAGVAGLGQLTDGNRSFGEGTEGYAHRLVTGYADQVIGNMMTEGFFPMLLREDPRYFRRGHGSKWSRVWYAATRVFVTRTDSGGTRFNFSEVVGNATAAAISNAYEPDDRDVSGNVEKLSMQIGIDAFSQVLKEFWPDIKHKLFSHHQDAAGAP